MDRRKFLKNSALSAASISMPAILPASSMLMGSAPPMSEHVVVVLFAGGVRQQESVLKTYLAESQNLPIEGNIMYNMLEGEAPQLKIVYGTTSSGGQEGGDPIASILSSSLQSQGTLFPEVFYSTGGTGHFAGLSTAVSGFYGITQGLQQRPRNPTIFEYLRKFRGDSATDVWFIGNGIGNSTPLLNYSANGDFGSDYGANFFAPSVTFGNEGEDFLKGSKVYHPTEELDPIREMRAFLNHTFLQEGKGIPNLNNTDTEKESIKEFIKQTFERLDNNQVAFPPVTDSNDLRTIGYSTEILRYFKPKLTVINMSGVDSCHANYTGYLKSLHRGDHAVGFLWNYIQNQIPEMSGKTTLIVTPEHGRNFEPNPITDANDWLSFDHDSDANSRRIWTLMAGPNVPQNLVVGGPNNSVGNAADIVPTIAEILGIKNEVLNSGFLHGGARSLFDRI